MASHRAGRGSNQYVTRVAPPPTRIPRTGRRPQPDLSEEEQIAWAFHPDREAWEELGWDSPTINEWLHHQFTPDEAVAFDAYNFDAENASEWRAAGFQDPSEAANWSEHFGPTEAAVWHAEQWLPECASILAATKASPAEISRSWRQIGLPAANGWVWSGFTAEDAVAAHQNGWSAETAHTARTNGNDPTISRRTS